MGKESMRVRMDVQHVIMGTQEAVMDPPVPYPYHSSISNQKKNQLTVELLDSLQNYYAKLILTLSILKCQTPGYRRIKWKRLKTPSSGHICPPRESSQLNISRLNPTSSNLNRGLINQNELTFQINESVNTSTLHFLASFLCATSTRHCKCSAAAQSWEFVSDSIVLMHNAAAQIQPLSRLTS